MDDGGTEPAPKFRVRVDRLGVVRVVWAPGAQIDGEAAREAVRSADELTADRQRPLLVEMTGTQHISREARQVFSRPMPLISRLALVGRSAVDRVVANCTLGSNETPMPTRFFTSEPAAMEWLLEARSLA